MMQCCGKRLHVSDKSQHHLQLLMHTADMYAHVLWVKLSTSTGSMLRTNKIRLVFCSLFDLHTCSSHVFNF